MPSKATSHRGAGAASRKSQVPSQRGQQARKAARPPRTTAEPPAAERPGTERPGAERPAAERPGTERPGTERPAAERTAAGARHEGPSVPRMPSMPASPSMPVLPSMRALRLPRVRVPGGTAGNMLWWGGLAAVAAFGVVDWPVAALVAAGTWVAERHAGLADRARAAR